MSNIWNIFHGGYMRWFKWHSKFIRNFDQTSKGPFEVSFEVSFEVLYWFLLVFTVFCTNFEQTSSKFGVNFEQTSNNIRSKFDRNFEQTSNAFVVMPK